MCWMTLTAWAARAIIRAANATGGCLHRLDIRTVSLDEDSLLEAARRETGLEDFGGDEFREPLRLVLHGLETEAHLTLLGRVVARRDLLGLLTNRLRLARDRARNPGIAEQRIVRPFFIIGLPRTGTTLLHHLISQDSASRSPQAWEVMAPSPPPEEARYETDPRIDDAEQVAVAANAVGLLADDDAGLAVGLVADETVHHVGADLFQRACPPDVGLLVEARLQARRGRRPPCRSRPRG
jgi:Sulfotransferase family